MTPQVRKSQPPNTTMVSTDPLLVVTQAMELPAAQKSELGASILLSRNNQLIAMNLYSKNWHTTKH